MHKIDKGYAINKVFVPDILDVNKYTLIVGKSNKGPVLTPVIVPNGVFAAQLAFVEEMFGIDSQITVQFYEYAKSSGTDIILMRTEGKENTYIIGDKIKLTVIQDNDIYNNTSVGIDPEEGTLKIRNQSLNIITSYLLSESINNIISSINFQAFGGASPVIAEALIGIDGHLTDSDVVEYKTTMISDEYIWDNEIEFYFSMPFKHIVIASYGCMDMVGNKSILECINDMAIQKSTDSTPCMFVIGHNIDIDPNHYGANIVDYVSYQINSLQRFINLFLSKNNVSGYVNVISSLYQSSYNNNNSNGVGMLCGLINQLSPRYAKDIIHTYTNVTNKTSDVIRKNLIPNNNKEYYDKLLAIGVTTIMSNNRIYRGTTLAGAINIHNPVANVGNMLLLQDVIYDIISAIDLNALTPQPSRFITLQLDEVIGKYSKYIKDFDYYIEAPQNKYCIDYVIYLELTFSGELDAISMSVNIN